MIVLYNAFLSCPLPMLNQRSPSIDVMSYKCYDSIWVSHKETAVETEHLSINHCPFIICNAEVFRVYASCKHK